MKFLTVAAAIVTLALPVLGQDLSGLPSCAQQPTLAGIGNTGCELTDISCICNNEDFLTNLVSEVQDVCEPSDFQKAQQFAVNLCKQAGVSLSLPGGASATASPSASGSATSASSSASATSDSVSATASETAAASGTESGAPAAFTDAAARLDASALMGMVVVGAVLGAGL